jgi:ABC-type transport system involved in multi-copper enzyme maturation permease subunit
MLSLLIRKELLDHLLSLRFAMACIICPAVVLSGVVVLTRDYKEALLDYNSNIVMHRNQLEEYDNPFSLVDDGNKVDKPLNPMKVFFRGVDEEHTATVRISAIAEPEFQSHYEKNPVAMLFPIMDLAFVAGVIMSLLAIAFSYDAIAGEKEMGTLKVTLSYSVPRDMILLGKWIGGYLSLIIPFILSILLALMVLLLFPEIDLRGEDWSSLLLALVGVLIYLSTIYTLGLFVSSRTEQASTSIMVLLLIWVVMVLVLPNLSPHIANLGSPVSSMHSVETEKAKIQGEEERKFMDDWRAWIQPAQENNTPMSEMVAKFQDMQTEMRVRIAAERTKINDQFRKEMGAQIRLTRLLAKLSPTALFTIAVCDLSGTGVQEQEHFRDLLKRYSSQWVTYAYDKFDPAIFQGEAELDASDHPVFVYAPLTFNDRIGETFIDILILIGWNLVFFMGAYLSFMRYDVK